MNFLKSNFKIIIPFVVGLLIAGSIVYAANSARDISYSRGNIKNVEEALNDLYSNNTGSSDLKNFQSDTNYQFGLNDILSSINMLKNENCINSIISSNKYREALLGNQNAIKALDSTDPITVPKLSNNNLTSFGQPFASSSFSSNISAWAAFDGDDISTYWNPAAGAAYKDQYVGYSFTNAVWVYKIYVNMHYTGGSTVGKQKAYCIIEATNNKDDDNSWIPITDEFYEGTHTLISKASCNQRFKHYRLRITRTTGDTNQNGGGNTVVGVLQFYGK